MAKEILSKFTEDEEHLYEMPESWAAVLRDRTYQSESPSSIRSFIACPLKWWLERYSPAPEAEPRYPLTVGTFIHRIPEVFYSEPAEERTEALFMRVFRDAWDDITQRASTGIIPRDLQAEFDYLVENAKNPDAFRGMFFKKARTCVENLQDMDGDPSEVKVVSNETWCRTEMNGITIRGKIDRIELDKFGREVIQDYKTGKSPEVPEAEDGSVDYFDDGLVAMIMYAYMRAEEIGGGQISDLASLGALELMYLANNEIIRIRITEDLIEDARHLMDQVTREMKEVKETGKIRITGADTPYQKQCEYCPAQAICPLWRDGTFDMLQEEVQI